VVKKFFSGIICKYWLLNCSSRHLTHLMSMIQ